MERIPIERGRVVFSTQGRDAGRCFVVLDVPEEGFVLLADGLTRKLDHPKRKKLMHLRPKPARMSLDEGPQLLDAHIRKFLRDYLQESGQDRRQPLCKED